MTGPWYDADGNEIPRAELEAAIARAADTLRIIAQPAPLADASLALAGRWPVTVTYGELETPDLDGLLYGPVAAAADARGCAGRGGGHDFTVYLFTSEQAAAAFYADVTALTLPSWWRVTRTATPTWK
jgi:hypothetical protein